jgi:hypothetical protein
MKKTAKPLYNTITANDSTSTASLQGADMKKIEVPEFYVYVEHGFPIICRNYVEALEMARKQSIMNGGEAKVLDLFSGKITGRFLNGKKSEDHGA